MKKQAGENKYSKAAEVLQKITAERDDYYERLCRSIKTISELSADLREGKNTLAEYKASNEISARVIRKLLDRIDQLEDK